MPLPGIMSSRIMTDKYAFGTELFITILSVMNCLYLYCIPRPLLYLIIIILLLLLRAGILSLSLSPSLSHYFSPHLLKTLKNDKKLSFLKKLMRIQHTTIYAFVVRVL